MENTLQIFKDRKDEIDFFFSVMEKINDDTQNQYKIDNERFFKIMKSNFLLMLYNLIEASIINGILEIYDKLTEDKCSYKQLIKELQKLWTDYKITKIYGPTVAINTYKTCIKKIIDIVIKNDSMSFKEFDKNILDINGNLDAKKIKKLCDSHKIRYKLDRKGECLYQIKQKRNALAHGDDSFSDCAKDFTINDLREMKEEVFIFLENILDGMKNYYDNSLYKSKCN